VLGAFGAVMAYRWFARSLAFIEGRFLAAILSDLLYSAIIIAGLGLMVLTHTVSFRYGGMLLLLAAIASLVTFGRTHWRLQFRAVREGRLSDYIPVFRNVTGWSLLGVALTEITLNAHAYLVTFIAGSGAFALPALGMLLMRPASLVQSALPDLERPAFMRAIAASDGVKLGRSLREFQAALGLVLVATMLLAAALLYYVPQWLLKGGYARQDVALAALFCALIMAARSVRTPFSVLLQAAGEFKALARLGGWSAAVSITATLALLLLFGAVASLGGILAGDIVILICIWPLARKIRRVYD
jgi:O-antigen/teichoic acid export membrane protein